MIAQRSNEGGEHSAAGSRRGGGETVTPTAMRVLASLQPVPNWLDARLNYAHKNLFKEKRKGSTEGVAKAQRELDRMRAKLEAWKAAQGGACAGLVR